MKVKKSSRSQGVVMEFEQLESEFLPVPLPGIELRKVLVAVDFSEQSRKALQYAISFARQFSSEVLLVHVVEPVPFPPEAVMTATQEISAWQESAARRLAKWREQAVSNRVSAKALVRNGIAHNEIVQAAEETNADLIVLGTHGRTGLAHVVMGSTAERVVQHAGCPVLVVRQQERDFVRPNQGIQPIAPDPSPVT